MPPSTGSKMKDAGKKTGDFDEREIKKIQLTESNENSTENNVENYENKHLERVSKGEKRPESSSKCKTPKQATEGRKLEKISSEKNRTETEGKEGRGSSGVLDKVPKRNAQRAKGSLSINSSVKSEENTKKGHVFSADSLPRTHTATPKKEAIGIPSKECPPSTPKQKMSDRALRGTNTRKPQKEDVKDVKDVKEGDKIRSTKKKKSCPVMAEEVSEEVIKKEESQFDSMFQEEPPKDTDRVCTAPPPSASCSFFGKIQQGVKAYFMSRNSLKFETAADEKAKKNITEGAYRYHEKEYFYRSTLHFAAPDPAIQHRVEPDIVPKNESEIQISRVATTSFKGSDIFKKRMRQSNRMKYSSSNVEREKDFNAESVHRRPRRNQKNSNSVLNDKSLRPRGKIIISKAAKSSFVPKYRNRLSSIVTQKLMRANLLEVGSDLSLKQSSFVGRQQKGANGLMNGDVSQKRADRKSKVGSSDCVQVKNKIMRGEERDGISTSSRKSARKSVADDWSRRPFNSNFSNFSSENEADQSSDASEPDCVKRDFSQQKGDETDLNLNAPTIQESEGDRIAEVETRSEYSDYSVDYLPDKTAVVEDDFSGNFNTVEELVEVINTFENFNVALPKKTFVYQALVKKNDSNKIEIESFDENESNLENIVTAKLMGDIDLHLELENYLKAISPPEEAGSSCKVRTKNTIQQNILHVICGRGENTDFEGSNIVDNKFGLSVSACELKSSDISENTTGNEKSKSAGAGSGTGRLSNETRTRSSSSFQSAVSVCTLSSPPRDSNFENQFLVFLDRKIENSPVSLENLDSKPTKDCASYIFPQVSEESKNVKKIRSENDASVQDNKAKGHIKRTVGEISLQPAQWDPTPSVLRGLKVNNSFLISLLKDTQGEPQSCQYEKISPLDPNCEGKPKLSAKGSVLFKNSFYSTSAESLKRNIINMEFDPNQLWSNFPLERVSSRYKFDNYIEEEKRSESVLSEKLIIEKKSREEFLSSQLSLIKLDSGPQNWSPSLKELIEIYNSVLKQNKKIRRCNIKRVKRCISNYIISFIHDKIREKMQKKELIKYAKERIGDSKLKIEGISDIYAGVSENSEKDNFSQLVEYVNRFQEVLTSSLSINQITQLNSIMAGLQDFSLDDYTPKKISSKAKTKKRKSGVNEKESSKSSVVSSMSKQKKLKCDGGVKKIKDVRETTSSRTNQLPKRNSSKTTANDKSTPVKEVKLPPFVELESVLKSCLSNSEKTLGTDSQPDLTNSCEGKENKFLVNVKLCENKIIVNGMQQFKNDTALPKSSNPSGKETSDLIIEKVSNEQIEKLKSTPKEKPLKSFNLNRSVSDKKKIKNPEVNTTKPEINSLRAGFELGKIKSEEIVSEVNEIKSEESVCNVFTQGTTSGEYNFQVDEEFTNKFEYDHHRLKIQHPIEAIIESSESKISERSIDNCNELYPGQEDSEFYVQSVNEKDGNCVQSDKDINLWRSLTKRHSKSSNVGSGEELSTPLQRACFTESSKRKPGTLVDLERKVSRKKIAKFTNPPDTTKQLPLQLSKKSAPKRKKTTILTTRPRSTYFCYPYIQCLQGDKTTKNKKVERNRNFEGGSASWSHVRTVSKEDSSKKGQTKTKVLKNISKGLSNLFKKTSEKRERSKKTKSISTSTAEIILEGKEKKNENSKVSEDLIDSQVTSSKIEEDVQRTELINFSINKLYNGSSFFSQNRSSISSTSSERCSLEPKNLENDKYSASEASGSSESSGISLNRLKKENHLPSSNRELEKDESKNTLVKRSFTNSSGTTDSYRRPTIVIHTRNEGNDDESFPSLMVLSESFLKCYSSLPLTKSKIKSLFKSHSDMKFYPGRVVDKPEEQTPFVTFVLTPKQRDEAGVPDNQIKIVTKPMASEEELKEDIQDENFHVNFGQITHENSLRAIELFIETLSKSTKKSRKKKPPDTKTNKATKTNEPKKFYVNASRPGPKKCKFVPCRRLQALFENKTKAYHECQKRLLTGRMENSKNGICKRNYKSLNRTKFLQMTSSESTVQSEDNERENPRINKSDRNGRVHEAKNTEDDLVLNTTRSCCIHQKERNTVGVDNTPNSKQNKTNVLPETVESFKRNERVIEASDEHRNSVVLRKNSMRERDSNVLVTQIQMMEMQEMQEMQKTENDKKISPVENDRNCISVVSSEEQVNEVDSNEKLKTVAITNHCTRSNSNEPETIDENSYPSPVEGVELLGNPTAGMSAEISDGERELLDYLLLEKEKPENLERKSSIYFDAEEGERERSSEETEEQFRQDDSFKNLKSFEVSPSTRLGDTVSLLKKDDLMADTTDNRWQEILSLLDDVSKEIEITSEEESDIEQDYGETAETKAMIPTSAKSEPILSKIINFLKKHTLDRTKSFWSKVKTVDEERESVQSTSCPSQNSFPRVESFRIKCEQIKSSLAACRNLHEVFSKLADYLNSFVRKVNVEENNDNSKLETRISSSCQELSVALYQSKSENLCETNSSGFLIHQTNNMFNIPEALSESLLKDGESNDMKPLEVLKQRIRKQRAIMQYLKNFPALPDVQVIKNRIIKRLGKLEKVVSILEERM